MTKRRAARLGQALAKRMAKRLGQEASPRGFAKRLRQEIGQGACQDRKRTGQPNGRK